MCGKTASPRRLVFVAKLKLLVLVHSMYRIVFVGLLILRSNSGKCFSLDQKIFSNIHYLYKEQYLILHRRYLCGMVTIWTVHNAIL